MIKIENKLFHGINISNYNETSNLSELYVLKEILKLGKILNRKDLYTEKQEIIPHLNHEYYQADNEICLAFHPNNKEYELLIDPIEDAFYDFIMNHISIILSEQLTINNFYKVAGIPREIRVEKSIVLPEYIEAIGYCDKVTKIITTINGLISEENYEQLKKLILNNYYHEFFLVKDAKKYVESEYQEYNQIREILQNTGYNIPIVDPLTGLEHNSIEENIDKVEITLNKIKKIRGERR